MSESGEPSDNTPPHSGWYFLIIATGILASLIISIFVKGGVGDMQRYREAKESLQDQLSKKKEKLQKLKKRKKRLHHDPFLIEKLARNKLGLERPGEKRVGLKRQQNPDTSSELLLEHGSGTELQSPDQP